MSLVCFLSAPNDYLSKTVDLTFQRSLMYLTTLCEHITIVNDNIPERQENFSLVLSSSNPDVRLGYGESGNQWNSNYIPNVTFIVINNDDCKFDHSMSINGIIIICILAFNAFSRQ